MPQLRPPRAFVAAGSLLACALAASPSRADVGADGTFSTEVPIEVPSLRGIQPSVELVYTSATGNGVVGVGWRLDATSAILRTGPRGGAPWAAPAAGDRFSLDGDELIPCAGGASPSCATARDAFGSDAGYYSTRRETFHRLSYAGGLGAWRIELPDGREGRYETLDNGVTWLLTHFDGDGQDDYAYVYARNPGIGVLTELTSGTPHRVSWQLAASAGFPLDDPAGSRWLAADVGSPAGGVDGKTDLVLVDTTGTTLQIYSLLARGDGTYAERVDQPWKNAAGAVVDYGRSDLRELWPLDVPRSPRRRCRRGCRRR